MPPIRFEDKLREWSESDERRRRSHPEEFEERDIRGNLLVPGHNYLGPGNPTQNGEPVDTADRIARHHDEHYEWAEDDSDIRAADWEAIGQFGDDFLNHGTWDSAVGAAGIGAKYLAETVTGVRYPSVGNGMSARTHHGPRMIGGSIRRPVQPGHASRSSMRLGAQNHLHGQNGQLAMGGHPIDGDAGTEEDHGDVVDGGDMDIDVGSAGDPSGRIAAVGNTGGGSSRGGTKGGAGGAMLKMWKCPTDKVMFKTFHHEHYTNLWGFGWMIDEVNNNRELRTSFGYVPVDMVGFWLAPYDLQSLPDDGDVKIVDCQMHMVCAGLTTSFETASTITGTASAHHWVQGMTAIGLNHEFPVMPMVPTITNMRITDVTPFTGTEWVSRRWGRNNYLETTATYLWNQALKLPRDQYGYTTIIMGRTTTTPNVTNTSTDPHVEGVDYLGRGMPMLEHCVSDFTAGDAPGQTLMSYSYQPTDGHIWARNAPLPTLSTAATGISAVRGPNFNSPSEVVHTFDATSETANAEVAAPTFTERIMGNNVSLQPGDTPSGFLIAPVEKSGFKVYQLDSGTPREPCVVQPSCHVGLYPVFPNAPGNATDNPINVKMTCKVLTKCVVRIGTGSNYSWFPTRKHTGLYSYREWQGFQPIGGNSRSAIPRPHLGVEILGAAARDATVNTT